MKTPTIIRGALIATGTILAFWTIPFYAIISIAVMFLVSGDNAIGPFTLIANTRVRIVTEIYSMIVATYAIYHTPLLDPGTAHVMGVFAGALIFFSLFSKA